MKQTTPPPCPPKRKKKKETKGKIGIKYRNLNYYSGKVIQVEEPLGKSQLNWVRFQSLEPAEAQHR